MKIIRTQDVIVATTGGAGASAGSAVSLPMTGELLDIYLNFGQASATTDTTITESTFGVVMVLTDSCTDGRYAPRMPVHTAAAGAITNGFDRYPLSDSTLTFALAQANDAALALTATIRWVTTF
jgi:hypothetical protein